MNNQDLNRITDFEKQILLEVLEEQVYPKSVKELRRLIRTRGINHPEYLITRALRELVSEDKVRFKGGRWMRPELSEQLGIDQAGYIKNSVSPPIVSVATRSILDDQESSIQSEHEDAEYVPHKEAYRGEWGTFRRLLKYYRECVRDEEGADASGFLTDLNKQFVFIDGIGSWYPRTGSSWNKVIPMGEHIADFQKQLAKNREDNTVVLGYPIEAVRVQKDEGEYTLIQPVFYFILNADFTDSSISLNTQDAQPEIAPRWIKYAFPSYPEQYSFLSACGLLNQPRPEDEMLGFTADDIRPDISDLARALSNHLPRRIMEPLNPNSVLPDVLPAGLKSGIYNRAVIMLGTRTKYTQTLLKELTAIEKQRDEILDKTALSYMFKEEKLKTSTSDSTAILHEAIVAETVQLNAEQREATAALIQEELSVITGPPGTGKSQVVVATIANARLRDQAVLFTSRNHKAIDAVYERARDKNGLPLLARANSKEDPTLKYSFTDAIGDLLSTTIDEVDLKTYNQRLIQLQKYLTVRGEIAAQANEIQRLRDEIGECQEELSWLNEQLPQQMVDELESAVLPEKSPSVGKVDKVLKDIVEKIESTNSISVLGWFLLWFRLIPHWGSMKRHLKAIPGKFKFTFIPPLRRSKIEELDFALYQKLIRYLKLQQTLPPLESSLSDMPELKDLMTSMEEGNKKIQDLATELTNLNLKTRGGLPSGSDLRQSLDGLRVALKAFHRGFNSQDEKVNAENQLEKHIPLLLRNFPCWSVTNLSVGSKIPLAPAIFDVAIIDEASQCDIASAIPILYRSKRAGAVGDPHQLRHVSKMRTSKDALFRKRASLTALMDQRYAYSETSLFDLFAKTNAVSPHMLRETYRSCTGIADYSNQAFYNGQLRVATDESRLEIPSGFKPGIHWTDIDGNIVSAGKSGCICEDEIEAVHDLVNKMLVENNFKGSVGIVTPFRMQANRLKDKIFEGKIPHLQLQNAKVVIDTAHGFQGDEKDVMIFSLCGGPGMPDGSRFFIRDSANLFNVAVSRARAVLHIIGNRQWALDSSIPHIVSLAKPQEERVSSPNLGPWAPYESPWEKKLAEALINVGITPTPQLPVAGRRLDLALVDDSRNIRIDIEVDGDAYHRNPDGSRKKDDLWRDLTMQARGWKVMRFWVYRLRDHMDQCVEEIKTAWRDHG